MEDLKKELQEYTPKLIKGIKDMAQHIQSGDMEDALKSLSHVIEGIDWVSKAYLAVSNKSVTSVSNLNNILDQINSSLNKKDYIMVSDLFEYEVVSILTDIFKEVAETNYN